MISAKIRHAVKTVGGDFGGNLKNTSPFDGYIQFGERAFKIHARPFEQQ